MRLRPVLVPLTLVVCAALSACGGGDDDKSDVKPADASSSATAEAATEAATETTGPATVDLPSKACDLLSVDAVSAAVEAPVKEGTDTSGPATSGGEFSSCAFASDDPEHPADTATIALYPNLDAADQGRGEDAQPIKGLGDQAYASAFGSVWVYVDDISLFVQWYALDGTDQENLPKSKALAEAAVDALR